jgi:dihydrofolate synthase/folylpolyglutamate synthase
MRFHRLDDWLAWQSTLHPREIELGLERVAEVWRRLRPGGLASRVVTVAGTNGKGSCVAMLEAIYRQAGYRVGAYTSPHLQRYNERIRIDGAQVDDARLCRAFERVDRARRGRALTYFEFGTLAALDIFARQPLDLVVLEVGLGGRLDAVNIIDPDVALITTVDLDHADWLGATRQEIGLEKAGIMRTGRPVVLATEMPESVYRYAQKLGAKVFMPERDFRVESGPQGFSWSGGARSYHALSHPALRGACQIRNAAAVLMAGECLGDALPVDRTAIDRALQTLELPGRLQILPGSPRILLDVAHNPQAVQSLRDHLEELALSGRWHAVFGILSDKDLTDILGIISPMIASWHLVDTPGPRGQSADRLLARMTELGIGRDLYRCGKLSEALDSAKRAVAAEDAILIFGSFLVVGEFLENLNKREPIELI